MCLEWEIPAGRIEDGESKEIHGRNRMYCYILIL